MDDTHGELAYVSKASFLQAGTVSRSWNIAVGAQLHTVSLIHQTVEGSYAMQVDGIDVPGR